MAFHDWRGDWEALGLQGHRVAGGLIDTQIAFSTQRAWDKSFFPNYWPGRDRLPTVVKEVLDTDMRVDGGRHSSEEDALRTLELALAASLSGFRKTSMATCERPSFCVVGQEQGQQQEQGGGSLALKKIDSGLIQLTLALKKSPCLLSWMEEGGGFWKCVHCGRQIPGNHESMALLRRVGGLSRTGPSRI